MIKIETVDPQSYAAEMSLVPGDKILSVNGQPIADILDYHLQINCQRLCLEVLHGDEIWELTVEKDEEEDFGVEVEHPEPRQCGNQCQFCFVHQLPKGMRKTLYIKDEDYRFSYLYGSYITLTNLTEDDVQRIIELQLSPLYVSVHASEPTLRNQLLGVDTPDVMPLIKRLTSAGISLHCQVVLCPGLNDRQVLEQTIKDLAALYPGVMSLAVVPVGLTRYRTKLPVLERVTDDIAGACLDVVEKFQGAFLARLNTRFVFAADEFYLKANRNVPEVENYEDFHQLENGVGMIAQFRQQGDEVLLEAEPLGDYRVSLLCGESFATELETFASRMTLRTGVKLQVVKVANNFFGPQVTVSGLVTGQDIVDQLGALDLGDALFIPDVMLRNSEDVFLDDMTVGDIELALGVSAYIVDSSPWGILEGLELFTDGPEIIHCRE